ncbi:MAG: aldo/keto reductase, partial [Planctomycetota bacterium]|nr:aldo/keto reductase [Planctomycetota bacterium]
MRTRFIKRLDAHLSPLGFGVMHLAKNADGGFPPEVHALLAAALEKGINYFDTGYFYLGGRSEGLIRDALVRRYPRDSFYIADKLPGWACKDRGDMERIFNQQLERLGVDSIDFYLLQALQRQSWLAICGKGVLDFLDEKRRNGQIRKVGFSMHDTAETLMLIDRAYGWDFAQLQINYYDWITQRAKESYEYLAERDIPCMVMEPVGGGRLAKLPPEADALLREVRPNASAASWALRFVAALPNVAVTLSGMSTAGQLDENIQACGMAEPLSEAEERAIGGVVKALQSKNAVPCGLCQYCVGSCPKRIDIPQIFTRYNDYMMFDNSLRLDLSYAFVPRGRRADSCISCGECAKRCPQNIDIPRELKRIHDMAVDLSIGVAVEKIRDRSN